MPAPLIFNWSRDAHAGDLAYIQGANFGATPVVSLSFELAGQTITQTVTPLSRADTFVVFKIPDLAGDFLRASVIADGSSDAVVLDAPQVLCVPSTTARAGATFEIHGKNLLPPGAVVALIGGSAVYLRPRTDSKSNRIRVDLPATLAAGSYTIIIGSTYTQYSGLGALAAQTLTVEAGAHSDLPGIDVPWSGRFSWYNTTSNPTIPTDGTTDATSAINAALTAASVAGGRVILPSGNIRVVGQILGKANTVLAGSGSTILKYEGNYPVDYQSVSNFGIENLTLEKNGGAGTESPRIQNCSFFYLKNVTMAMTQRYPFITGNSSFVFDGVTASNGANASAHGALLIDGKNAIIRRSTVQGVSGAIVSAALENSLVERNTFIRDATNQNEASIVHYMALEFCTGLVIRENKFRNIGGPITNLNRNDGEGILAEGGGGNRTEQVGMVTSAAGMSLTDSGVVFDATPWSFSTLPVGTRIAIIQGKGVGQTRKVASVSGDGHTVNIDVPWVEVPDTTSRYVYGVSGLSDSLIYGNEFFEIPRSIWIYQCLAENVYVERNTMWRSGGPFFRSVSLGAPYNYDTIQVGCTAAFNAVLSDSGEWPAAVTAAHVVFNTNNRGTGMIGFSSHDNVVLAHSTNITRPGEDHARFEGFRIRVPIEGGWALTGTMPQIATLSFRNRGVQVASAATVETGVYGHAEDNSELPGST